MRVVVAHNFYRSETPSGENRVVEQQIDALRGAGVDVALYGRSSDEIAELRPLSKGALAWRPIYSREDAGRFAGLLRRYRPGVVQLHNPFPLISPTVINVAHGMDIPVVQTVHNYRHACPAGTFFRDGHVCEECLGHPFAWPAVRHGCYRSSRPQTVPIAVALRVHKPTWRRVERYLAVSEFVAEKLVAAGISADRVRILPNAADDPGEPGPPGRGFLFVGRLTEEKGIALLLDAWKLARLGNTSRLVIVGDGEQRPLVESRARGDASIEFRGRLPFEDVARAMVEAAVVVIPSVCYEGFPVVAAEAMARGRPILASDLGALHDVVDDAVGWRSVPEPGAFASALALAGGSHDLSTRAANARRRFLANYRREAVTEALIGHLADAAHSHGR